MSTEKVAHAAQVNIIIFYLGLLFHLRGSFRGCFGLSGSCGSGWRSGANLLGALFNKFVEFLAFHGSNQVLDLGGVRLGTSGLEDLLDIISSWVSVSTQNEQSVRSDVLHL